jgi:hypothetical protein
VAAPGFSTAGGIASHQQGMAAFAEIAGVICVFRDLPGSGEAYAVRMKDAAITLPIQAPPQIGFGIDLPLARSAKHVGPAKRQNAAEHARQRDFVDGQRRFAMCAPHALVRICKQRLLDLGEARAVIGAVFVREEFRPKEFLVHGEVPSWRSEQVSPA